ncbi:MAG: iron ABC transporter permease [PVC group bacterium]|nr:iron ABC transporter permease [PVC group bacterium]
MKTKVVHWAVWIVLLGLILLGISIIALVSGTTDISFSEIIRLFQYKDLSNPHYSIIFQIRLPRILLGFAVGSALSIAGVILQGMFRNPLVEPYTLGISGGAVLGVCLIVVFRLHKLLGVIALPIAGSLGAICVVLLVYFLSMRKGMIKIQGLLLSGVMISFICSSLVMLIMAVMRAEDVHGIIFWIMGSLEQSSWFLINSVTVVSLIGLGVAYCFCRDLNAFSLGEEGAKHLGVNTETTKKILFLLASILTGMSVSVAGVIGFVGLVIPHFMRIYVGSDHRILLVASSLAGAAFLIGCDTLARIIIAPQELPVGVITGIVGGIVFIYALICKKGVNKC